MRMPADHPLRFELNDEVHARPPEPLEAPLRMSYLAIMGERARRDRDIAPLIDLAERFKIAPPGANQNHFRADFGPFRLKWERHTEFARFTFMAPGGEDDPFGGTAISKVPEDWLAGLEGEVVVAAHAAVLKTRSSAPDPEEISKKHFAGNVLIGSAVADGAGVALTDFRIRGDGFSRLLVLNKSMSENQTGRTLQRLFEIDTYRVMALLALPQARVASPFLDECETELAKITRTLSAANERDETLLLDRLTRLDAELENRNSQNHYRFAAAAAYHALVKRRIAELRETRIRGLQTFQEFTERRLEPAMNTCETVANRQESLSQRVARTTHLLSTRVDINHERQNQALLESMNRRAKMQLRLQETVEALSVAAVTYYAVGLVGYAAKGAEELGVGLDPALVMAVSIPIVALLVIRSLRRARKLLKVDDD
ncbi:MAG: DUF3422 family protein [Minwuia sp.]|uniref:DUF3422 family protein n=1 Tax=Minwuia sp. TaxID=2493630 RepID=UPI003A8982B0